MSNWLDFDGLRLAAAPSKRDQILLEILLTQLPSVHFNVVDNEVEVEVELSPTTLSSQTVNAGRSPRLADGARESLIVLGSYQLQTVRDWGSAMNIVAQGSNGDPSTGRSGEFQDSFSKAADGVVGAFSHSQYLEFLGRKVPNLLMRNLEDKDTICRMLLIMAENVKVLAPGE